MMGENNPPHIKAKCNYTLATGKFKAKGRVEMPVFEDNSMKTHFAGGSKNRGRSNRIPHNRAPSPNLTIKERIQGAMASEDPRDFS